MRGQKGKRKGIAIFLNENKHLIQLACERGDTHPYRGVGRQTLWKREPPKHLKAALVDVAVDSSINCGLASVML